MRDLAIYAAAALAEIAGCYGIWAWARLGRPAAWLAPAILCLCLFGWLLTRIDLPAAGRAFAAYGGIYVIGALVWLWLAEGIRPDRWDVAGAALCLAGTLVILLGHRS